MDVKRVFWVVLDGVGVGELPDASLYHDQGSNTLGNTAQALGGIKLPFLEAAGLGKLTSIAGVSPHGTGKIYGKMAERSAGKDTTTGHWEMAGLILPKAFPLYPDGFPAEIIQEFSSRTGRKVIGNKAASGTAIIDELGPQQMRTGDLIVYTSADSVFQIAAHEEVIPLTELYRACEIAREILHGDHSVGRVIARPFLGQPGAFNRTERRRDFSIKPFAPTVLDRMKANRLKVYGVGKLEDIFCGQGFTDINHTPNSQETLAAISQIMTQEFTGLAFANCIDFDMLYGHRNDPKGFGKAMEEVDAWLSANISSLLPGDVFIITGDHGVDPTTSSTDHSREYTPLLVFGPGLPSGVDLGIRKSFADLAATLCYWFHLDPWPVGDEFGSLISKAKL